jgi:DNA-directed RNA polymerase beta subunit
MSDNNPPRIENELHPDLLGVNAINPWVGHDSSSRAAMLASHIGQSLVVKGANIRRCQTGVEREYAKYTFSLKMPCNALIIRCIQMYPKTMGENQIKDNPITTIIYEDVDSENREIGILDLVKYHHLHQHYGFHYQYRSKVLEKLMPGSFIPKGTVIADSPAVSPDGDYMFGVETNIALMSYQPVIEDGVIVSDEYIKKLTATAYGNRTVSFGKDYYPLNLYGDETRYKPFPDIGDKIRPDGLLFALRQYDEMLAPIHMTPKDLMEVDYVFDRTIYAEAGARVVDIEVYKGCQPTSNLPSNMTVQCEMYYRKELQYYSALVAEYESMRRKRGEALKVNPEFHRLLVKARAFLNDDKKNRINKTINRVPLDEWCVDLTFEYESIPTVGSKITDLHGGKGVIVEIMKEEDMPIDAAGNRAEIIMDADSTIKRMNLGRLYEQYINASARNTQLTIERLLGNKTQEEIELAWDYLMGFYQIVSPRMYEAVISSGTETRKLQHLECIVEDGIYMWLPTDTPVAYPDVVRALRDNYPAVNGPVTYRGASGIQVTTKSNIIIGSMYIVLLEKMGNTWAAVSSSKLQHFGIPAKLTNADRYSSPIRNQPVRILGESEVRLFAATVGGDTTADLLDQSNNPVAHKLIIDNILESKKPTAIKQVIDRTILPKGQGRPLQYVNHVLECSGIKFARGTDKG